MIKKTKKFYFFNKFKKLPGSQYLFYLFKRAVMQNYLKKNLNEIFRTMRPGYIKTSLKISSKIFKILFKYNIQRHQWNLNRNTLPMFFFKSAYRDNICLKKNKNKPITKKKLLYSWFVLKHHYYKRLRKRIWRYTKKNFLFLYITRMFLNKVLYYQAKFKYKSKYFNIRSTDYYVYIHYKWLALFFKIINSKCFFFTANVSKKNLYLDDIFTVYITNWNFSTLLFKRNAKFNITTTNLVFLNYTINHKDYNLHDLNTLSRLTNMITQYTNEKDLTKKNDFLQILKNYLLQSNIDLKLLDIIFIFGNLFFSVSIDNSKINDMLNLYLIEYFSLYNNNDISPWEPKNSLITV